MWKLEKRTVLLCEASRAPSCSNVNSKLATLQKGSVRELMGWVRNVALIKCIFGSGKPKGGRDFGWEGHGSDGGTGELVYEQPGNEVDESCHKRRVP